MIGWSKNNRKSNPRKCFLTKKKKKPALKFNPGKALISLPTAGPCSVKPAFQLALCSQAHIKRQRGPAHSCLNIQ